MEKRPTCREILNAFIILAEAFPERRDEYQELAFRHTLNGFDLSILGLKKRTENALRAHGMHTTRSLTHMTGSEIDRLIRIRGIWTKSLAEIKEKTLAFVS